MQAFIDPFPGLSLHTTELLMALGRLLFSYPC
jgi:hypothetical protein